MLDLIPVILEEQKITYERVLSAVKMDRSNILRTP